MAWMARIVGADGADGADGPSWTPERKEAALGRQDGTQMDGWGWMEPDDQDGIITLVSSLRAIVVFHTGTCQWQCALAWNVLPYGSWQGLLSGVLGMLPCKWQINT